MKGWLWLVVVVKLQKEGEIEGKCLVYPVDREQHARRWTEGGLPTANRHTLPLSQHTLSVTNQCRSYTRHYPLPRRCETPVATTLRDDRCHDAARRPLPRRCETPVATTLRDARCHDAARRPLLRDARCQDAARRPLPRRPLPRRCETPVATTLRDARCHDDAARRGTPVATTMRDARSPCGAQLQQT